MKKRLVIILTALFLSIAGVFVSTLYNSSLNANAFYTTDASYYVSVGELGNGSTTVTADINENNFLQLCRYLTNGGASGTVTTMATAGRNATYFRSSTYNGKTTSQDIVVKLGGLDWTAVYLSKDTSGNVILTLWLANSQQLSGLSNGSITYNANGASYWHISYNSTSYTTTYPQNMYGTSYMNVIHLNNGGYYKNGAGTATLAYRAKVSTGCWAPFTYSGLTNYIVTPAYVDWQKNEQSYHVNDNWATNTTGGYDYGNRAYYSQWSSSYLWLPSVSETGASGESAGIWGTSTYQRRNSSVNTWTRSNVNETYGRTAYYLASAGTSVSSTYITTAYAHRPALHFNMTAAANNIASRKGTSGDFYLDAAYGSDSGSGNSLIDPVKTLTRIDDVVTNGGIVNVLNNVPVIRDTSIGTSKNYTIRKWKNTANNADAFTGAMFTVGNSITSPTVLTLNSGITLDGFDSVLYKTPTYIDVQYGCLTLNNCKITNANSGGTNHLIYVRRSSASIVLNGIECNEIDVTNGLIYNDSGTVTINDGIYNINNLFGTDGYLVQCANIDSNVLVNGGSFTNGVLVGPNSTCNWIINNGEFNDSSIFALADESRITINGGTFTNKTKIYTSSMNGVLEINNGLFDDGTTVHCNEDSAKIEINGGTFKNNYAVKLDSGEYDSIISGKNITIKNATFINNKTNFENTSGGESDEEALAELEILNIIDSTIKVLKDGLLVIENCVFNDNTGIQGGVIWADTGAEVEIYDSEFLNNMGLNEGGIIYLSGNNVLNINNSTFEENSSKIGGVIFANNNCNITIEKSNFIGNIAENVGGVIFGLKGNRLNISSSIFTNNVVNSTYVINEDNEVSGGGAIFITGDNNIIYIFDSSFIKNTALTDIGNGGALYINGSSEISIISSAFKENVSTVSGGSIFINNTTSDNSYEVQINDSTFDGNETTEKGGAVYVTENTKVRYYKCTFKNNVVTGEGNSFGGAIYNGTVYNSTFEGNLSSYYAGAAYNAISYDNTFNKNSSYIGGAMANAIAYNCLFVENTASYSGGALFNPKSIINCTFINNSAENYGGAIYITSGNVTIINSEFESNSSKLSGGAIGISMADTKVYTLTITNGNFIQNYSGERGGAIFNSGSLKLELKGETNIRNNVAKDCGAGIYFVGDNAVKGSEIIFGDYLYRNIIYIYNNFKGNSLDEFLKDSAGNFIGEEQNNLFVDFGNGDVNVALSSNIITGSKIGVIIDNFINDFKKVNEGYVFSIYPTETETISQETFNAFVADDLEDIKFYTNTIYNNSLKTGVGLYFKLTVASSNKIIYVASDNYCSFDGNSHGIEIEVLNPVSGYTIWYSTEENGNYTTDVITIKDSGETLDVWFYITAQGYETTSKESRTISIDSNSTSQKNIYYDIYSLSIELWIGQPLNTKSAGGTNISKFTTAIVKDEDGNAVVCDFIMFSSTSSTEIIGKNNISITRELNIIPKNTEKYKSITGLLVDATIGYSNLYFKNTYFFPDENEMNENTNSIYKVSKDDYNIADMIGYINDYGIIYFADSYIENKEVNVIIDKHITFIRYKNNSSIFLGSIINILEGGKLNFSITNEAKLTFSGLAYDVANSVADALITNAGILNISGNTYFENIYNSNTATNGGVINSSGTLFLKNVIFNNCRALTRGGAIYATGKTTLTDSTFDSCRGVLGGALYLSGDISIENCLIIRNIGANSFTADSTVVKGVGLFITGTTTKATIFNTRILNNTFNFVNSYCLGAGAFIEGGYVEFIDCDISYNTSYSGGGLVVGTNSQVNGEKLRIEGNTLLSGSIMAYNMGAGVYVERNGSFNLISGFIRSNGISSSSTTHYIKGIGIYVDGDFTFATDGDTNSQISLNSDDKCEENSGGGIYCSQNGLVTILGGVVSQNYNRYSDLIISEGTIKIGGTSIVTGYCVLNRVNTYLTILDNWEDFNKGILDSFKIRVNENRSEVINSIIVKGDKGFNFTFEEWKTISSRIDIVPAYPTYLSGEKYTSYDSKMEEYSIYYKTDMPIGTGVFYFNPSAGDDLKDGTTAANAVKSWNAVISISKPGDTIILCSVWAISDDFNIDGEGRTLKRLSTFTGYFIQVTGTYIPVVNISNLIIDGNKYKDGTVVEGNWAAYLNQSNGGSLLYTAVSCKINLNNVTIKNHCGAYGAIRFQGSTRDISFSAIDCNFINNTMYTNYQYGGVIDIRNSNSNFDFYLSGCTFSGNESIYSTTSLLWAGVCILVAGSSTTSKTNNFIIQDCVFDNNYSYNSSNYATYGKIISFTLNSFGLNEKINIDFDNCEFSNNKDRTYIGKSQQALEGLITVQSDNVSINFSCTNCNFKDNISIYSIIRLDLSTSQSSQINIENCIFEDNQYVYYTIYVGDIAKTTINNCKFIGQTRSYNIYTQNPLYEDITITNCEFYNSTYGIYTHAGAKNVIVTDIKFSGNYYGWVFNTSTINGTLFIKNIYAEGAYGAINIGSVVVGGSTISDIYIENCYDGIDIGTGVNNVTLNNITIKDAMRYGIYSNAASSVPRTILAYNVKITGGRTADGTLRLNYTDFIGEDVTISNSYLGIYLIGGMVSGVSVDTCYMGMQVYNNQYRENHVSDIKISNISYDGIQYLYLSQLRLVNSFKNVTISNCYRYAFYDGTLKYANNLIFEDCVFEKSYFGYYRSFATTDTYNNIDITTFINCIFRYNRYDGAYLAVYYNASCSIVTTYNLIGCLSENNGRFGYNFYKSNTYGGLPVFNIDEDTTVRYNRVGLYIAGESTTAWFTLNGGKFIDNTSYGIYSVVFLTVSPSTEGGVVVKNNGINEYGEKIYKDIYTTRYYLGGTFDIESLMCGTTTSGIYINSSIANSEPVDVYVMGAQTVNAIIAQGNSYTPTNADYEKLVSTNWDFKISSSQLLLSSVSSKVEEKSNVYYFDPQRTRVGSGLLPDDPITSWDELYKVLDSDVTIYVMSYLSISGDITLDAKGATFKPYINPTLATPAYYYLNSIFRIIAGNVVINNIKIDGNSNVNGFLSAPTGGQWNAVVGSLKWDIEGAIAYVSGNSTLTINNMYVTNLCTKNAIRLVDTTTKLYVNNSVFKNISADTNGFIYSQGSYVSINECNFNNYSGSYAIYHVYANNAQLFITDCEINNSGHFVYFNGAIISVDKCDFYNTNGYCFYINNATNASSSSINNCNAKNINYFVYVQATLANFLKLENIEIDNAYSYGIFLANTAYMKTITVTNVTIRNSLYAFAFYQYSNITLTNYQAINNNIGMGITSNLNIPYVTITIHNSKFLDNVNGFYFSYYFMNNVNYSTNLTIDEGTIFENNKDYAIYYWCYTYINGGTRATLSLNNVEIINNGYGIYAHSVNLNIYYTKIKNCSKQYSINYDITNGCSLNFYYSEISGSYNYGIYFNGTLSSTGYGYRANIYYSHFYNNRVSSIHITTAYPYLYIHDTVFDETSGTPTTTSYFSIYRNNASNYVYLSGQVIIRAGIRTWSANALIYSNGAILAGSYIRVCLAAAGTHNATIATAGPYAQFFHVDGWNVIGDATYVRLSQVNAYIPQSGGIDSLDNTAIYFDPLNGNDNFHGHSYSYPVKTWERVEEINTLGLPVYIMNEWNITESVVIDGHGWRLMRCCEGTAFTTGSIFNISGEGTMLTLKNIILDGNYLSSACGAENSGTRLIATMPIINAGIGTSLIIRDSKIQNALANNSSVAVATEGNIQAYNSEFIRLYSVSSNYPYAIYCFGEEKREVVFNNCYISECNNYISTYDNTNAIQISGNGVTVNISDCLFENNISNKTKNASTGIVSVIATNSKLYVSDSKFRNNSLGSHYEMTTGIYVSSLSCEISITGCYFGESADKNNSVLTKDGGAIYIRTNSKIEIIDCEFENCYANNGAGIYFVADANSVIQDSSGLGEVISGLDEDVEIPSEEINSELISENLDITLLGLVIKNNIVENGNGGAIYIDSSKFVGGELNIGEINAYYVFGSSVIYVNMDSSNIVVSQVLIDGSNFSHTSVSTNSGGIYLISNNDGNIIVNDIIIENCVTNNNEMSHIEVGSDEGKIEVSSLHIERSSGNGSLFNIKGGNVIVQNGSFTKNSTISMLGFENNNNVVINSLLFESNTNGYSIYTTSNKAVNYDVNDITVTNNNGASGIHFGGNSRIDSIVNIRNVIIENNTNMFSGVSVSTSKANITNTIVKNNTSTNSVLSSINAEVTISYSDILYNLLVKEGKDLTSSAFISRGIDMFVEMSGNEVYASGAMSFLGGKVNLNQVNVTGNISADFGGGIVSVAPIVIENSKINNNKANSFGGGLILTMDAEIYSSTVSNNFAETNGGGIWFGAGLKLDNTELIGNISKLNGSAIYSFGDKASMQMSSTVIKQNVSYGDGGVYFVNDRGSVELVDVEFSNNTGYGKGAALYINSLTFVESNIVFSGNNIHGTLINFENVANFEMSDFVVSGNYGYGENATLFSFTTAQGNSSRMLFRDGRIYGNKMEYNASVVIDDGLYIRMTNVEVTGNSNLYSGADLTTDNGKGGAIFVKNGTLVLEDGLAVDNWAEYGAWLFVGSKGKAVISSQEISNISTDLDTTINGVIYVEKNGELELHNCKILGISLASLKGALNNNGHTLIVDSAIYDNNTENSIIYNGGTGVINLDGVDLYSNSTTNGGAIYNLGVINFVSGKIRNNTASLGGAIYNEGDFTLSGGNIISNTANQGGAIYNLGKIILSSGSISNNTASTSGAGIYNEKDAIVIMQGGEISKNTKAENGTGILGSGIANYGSLYIYGGNITSNGSTETGNGGGLYAGANSYNYIENGVISNNLAGVTSSGANIYLSANSYTLIKNSSIISGRTSSSNSLMDINITNATLILDNVTLNSSVNSGSLRADNSNITILNSYITNLKPSEEGSSFYIFGGNLVIENTTIANTSSSSGSVMYLDNVISASMQTVNFVENSARAVYIDVTRVATNVNIKNSTFAGNTTTGNGGAIFVGGNESSKANGNILITTSTFTSNVANLGGAIYLGAAYGTVVELYDTILGGYIDTNNNGIYDGFDSMLGNYAKTGGAIYIEETNPASLVLKGEVTITYNSSLEAGGGVYYAFNGETDYDNNIYGLSIQSGAIVTIKNNYTNSTQISVSTRDENNLHLSKDSNKGVIVADLSSSSQIGITIDEAEKDLVVITTYKRDIPVTTTDFNVFSYDNYNFTLKLDALMNALVLVGGVDNNADMIVYVSDIVYTMDGSFKTITAEDFTVYNCRDYTIYFAETEDGEYFEIAPSYVEIKDYTIWYKVVDSSNLDRQVIGKINFRITGRILSIVEAPTAYINAGDKLSSARFENGLVKSGDLFVSGTWSFENGNIIPNDINTRYLLKFTPSDKTLYENTVSVLVAPTIAFNRVYFFEDKFYNDTEHTSFTGISSLSTMVSYLNEGGEIFFMSSYTVGNNGILEETITTDKKIFLYRHISFTNAPIILIPSNTNTIRFSLGGGVGSIYITGGGSASSTETEPLFVNNGILSINNNVHISNITNSGGGPAVAHNYEGATLNLNGCYIYNTYVDINTVLLTGGSIYNEGIMIINGGDYRFNYTVNGNGGFIYNTGALTINSGLFARNYTVNGSGGCIYTKGGSVVFNGGEFIGNSANYGGVICVDEEGDATINGANFYSNVANVMGASIFTISGNVIQNGGDFKFNVNLALKNSANNNGTNGQSNEVIYMVIAVSLLAVILTSILIIIKKRNKNIIKLKK